MCGSTCSTLILVVGTEYFTSHVADNAPQKKEQEIY